MNDNLILNGKDGGEKNARPSRPNLDVLFDQWRSKVARYSMLAVFPALLASNVQDAVGQVKSTSKSSVSGRVSTLLGDRRKYKPGAVRTQRDLLPAGVTNGCPGKAVPPGTYTAAAPYVDSGDTTGASNTVNSFYSYFYGYSNFGAAGPDQVYTFTVTAVGPNPQIEVVAANPGSYKPLIYLTDTGCPSGTGNYLNWTRTLDDARFTGTWGDGAMGFYGPLNQRVFLFIDSQTNDSLGSGAYTLKLKDMTVAYPEWGGFDFSGYGGSGYAAFRPSDASWYLEYQPTTRFGISTDKIVPADYDNDGKTDIAIFRDGQWWWINSSDSTVSVVQFGTAGDTPVPADYTGDGRDEIAVYRSGVWWSLDLSNSKVSAVQFGLPSDKPIPADYDGDGKKDRAIYRDGTWWILKSSGEYYVQQWGLATDKIVPADYDGDGKTDLAVYRDGDWYVLRSSGGTDFRHWGRASDIPVPADYPVPDDYIRDGKADLTVFRDGVYYVLKSNGTFEVIAGPGGEQAGDLPAQAAYAR